MFKTIWHSEITELVEHILDWNGKWQASKILIPKKYIYLILFNKWLTNKIIY